MAQADLGENVSLWIATTPSTDYSALPAEGVTCDAMVVGGGITGVMTALRLQQAGVQTVLLDKAKIVEYTTGNTTAKLTSQHYLVYKYLIDTFGEDVARSFAVANQDAIDEIEDLSQQFGIDCDFERRDAYVYTQLDDKVKDIEEEVAASQRLGLPSSFETKTDLPYEVKAAIRFADQAQFHPRKFLLGVAQEFVGLGGQIYEQTEAKAVEESKEGYIVKTDKGDVRAKYLVDATRESFWQWKLFEPHVWLKISYGLAIKLKDGADYPKSMYITTDDPLRSIRSHPYEGGQILIFGGESHELTDEWDEDLHYNRLLEDAKQRFPFDKTVYRWLAGDVMPYDRLPYIGQYPGKPNAYAATGFHAWGLGWGPAAAHIITGAILGHPLEWAKSFDLSRLK
jgi:glycine/D-amino acid oxidase-like deaminating enzyme